MNRNDRAGRQTRPATIISYPPTKIPRQGDSATPQAGVDYATDLQAALAMIDGALRGLEQIASPRRYATTIDILWRKLDAERRRPSVARWLREAA